MVKMTAKHQDDSIHGEGMAFAGGGLAALGRERADFDPPVRIHPVAEHLMIYCIEADSILFIRILGGRQNCRAMLEVIDA